MGSQEEKFVEPKVLLRALPIITVKTYLCVYMYVSIRVAGPIDEVKNSVSSLLIFVANFK